MLGKAIDVLFEEGVDTLDGLASAPAYGSATLEEEDLARTIHARRNPIRRLATPQDVVDVIYLLSTDEAAWINGALIRVDGGEHVSGGVG